MEVNFIGKKVTVKKVDTPFDKNAIITGTCTFFGFNELLKKKQITIDRMPIFLDNFNQVSLY